jgi:hypothetical protein
MESGAVAAGQTFPSEGFETRLRALIAREKEVFDSLATLEHRISLLSKARAVLELEGKDPDKEIAIAQRELENAGVSLGSVRGEIGYAIAEERKNFVAAKQELWASRIYPPLALSLERAKVHARELCDALRALPVSTGMGDGAVGDCAAEIASLEAAAAKLNKLAAEAGRAMPINLQAESIRVTAVQAVRDSLRVIAPTDDLNVLRRALGLDSLRTSSEWIASITTTSERTKLKSAETDFTNRPKP